MQNDQTAIFAQSEGDRWFRRCMGPDYRLDTELDLPCRMIAEVGLQPSSILEIGAGSGARLAHLVERYRADAVAVEPSNEAISSGQMLYDNIKYIQATADAIPLDGPFDLVIIHFVLHWVDRCRLLRSTAEIDRLVADGGHLLIGDFWPERPCKVHYHHLPDQQVYTYKQNYSELFTGTGLYRIVRERTADHATMQWAEQVDSMDRVGLWLLKKDVSSAYPEMVFHG